MNKKVKASFSASVYADCPHCNDPVDVFDQVSEVVPEHLNEKELDETVICPECNKEFEIDEIEF